MTSNREPTMTDASSPRTRHAARLFAGLGRRYDRMGALLSFGQDARWRRFLVSRLPEPAGLVLDVATGTGLVARELRATRRARRVVGIDPSEPMLRAGTFDASTSLVLARAEHLPFADAAFDGLTVTYLLRYVDDPAATLRELARVVRPGGVVASLEFGVPPEPVWDGAWWLYTRIAMPAIGALVSRDWYEVGRFLGPSIDRFWRSYPLAAQLQMWRAAGLGRVQWRRMSLGGGVVMWAARER
jgi:demethylmenaquinone methyltransferase/2-methoxy-6-polyprenyl-1,4-benzoquinol methylase